MESNALYLQGKFL